VGPGLLDEEEEGYFEFDEKGWGSFHFGYVHGTIDGCLTTKDGEPDIARPRPVTPDASQVP
jgi:hypothetical protein